MSATITVPIVAGRCPFDAEAPPAAGVTPATHFALARGPASDTAVLLRFATHRWHSRLVAALKEDAAAQGSLATAEQFVLVVPPEPIRDDVVPVLVELLELRRRDPRFDSGIWQTFEGYVALLDAAFPDPADRDAEGDEGTNEEDEEDEEAEETANGSTTHDASAGVRCGRKRAAGEKQRTPALHNPHHAAAACQVCRLGEFLQCNAVAVAAAIFLNAWLNSVADSGQDPAYVRLLLKCLCSADIGQAASAEDQFEAAEPIPCYSTPPVDLAFVRSLVDGDEDCIIGYYSRWITPRVRAYIPPCAVPRRVASSCFDTDTEGHNKGRRKREREDDDWDRTVRIVCGRRIIPACYLFVTEETAQEDHPDCILHFLSAEHVTRMLDYTAKGVVLPPSCDIETVFASELLVRALFVTFPDDFDDSSLERIDQTCMHAKVMQLSNTKITAIPPHWCAHDDDIEQVHFPPTLKTIGPGAFVDCQKLRSVTGLEGVDVSPTAFFNSEALSHAAFGDATP